MKYFWSKTGVQPVIYLKEYDPSLGIFEMSKTEEDAFLTGDSDSGGWLDDWFESQEYSEATYAFVYFDGPESGELYEDTYQFYSIPGRLVGPVMDSEAEDIFFSYLESYWHMDPSVMSEDHYPARRRQVRSRFRHHRLCRLCNFPFHSSPQGKREGEE